MKTVKTESQDISRPANRFSWFSEESELAVSKLKAPGNPPGSGAKKNPASPSSTNPKDINTFVNNRMKNTSMSNAVVIPKEEAKSNDLRYNANPAKTFNKNGVL